MLHYLQFRQLASDGHEVPAPVIASRLFGVLHGAFRQMPNKYAIAIPQSGFASLRVFAQSREDLGLLCMAVAGHHVLRDYYCIDNSVQVPSDFTGAWISYRRFRIPLARADRNARADGFTLAQRRMALAQHKGLVFFDTLSQTSGQRFSLHVQRVAAEGPGIFSPNSYGLASVERPFALPVLA